jgi:hypothetical protein
MSGRRWTAKGALARSVRNIDAAIERIRKVSIEWSDVDGYWENEAETVIGQLEHFRDELRNEINERLAAGEHVGL